MYTEEQLEQAFYAGKEYAHAGINGHPTIGLRFSDFKDGLVKESDSLPCVSERFHCSTPDCGITRGRKCFEEKCEDWSGR